MAFKILHYVVLPLYVLFTTISSILLDKTPNGYLLISFGLLLVISVCLGGFFPKHLLTFSIVGLVLLFSFHLFSHLNWCVTLYLFLLIKILNEVRGIIISLFLAISFMFVYSVVRISYTPLTSYNLLNTGADLITAIAIVLVFQYIVSMEWDRTLLKGELGFEEQSFRSEKLKVVGELAAGMAHEIRNPLTTVKGFLQLSQKHDYNIKPWYDIMVAEIDRMNELTVEFLEFSKPHQTSYKVLSIHQCLQKVISITWSEANIRGHEIIYTEYRNDLFIRMDIDKLVQVLVNLIKNAYESMQEHGKVTVRVLKKDRFAVIILSDTGKGIKTKELINIFDPFFTTKPNGTGLGLSISLKIIEDHGGKIEVSRTSHRGTTFNIYLPLHVEGC
ncbi:MAG: GHKL domain-containing protein [Gorillibacterium sp.]|nr:GHKL domain-containing protein [Gorillibacterium sp.]